MIYISFVPGDVVYAIVEEDYKYVVYYGVIEQVRVVIGVNGNTEIWYDIMPDDGERVSSTRVCLLEAYINHWLEELTKNPEVVL